MDGETYLFAGGGTGGHLYPGIAVAHRLHALRPNAKIVFFTTDRALDGELLSRTPFEHVPQRVRPFSPRPWHWPRFLLCWSSSVSASRNRIRRDGVRAVLGLGGYAAGPPVHAARSCGVRCGTLNPDAIPGLANRYLAGRVDLVALQWGVSRRYFKAGAPCLETGCPIRAEFSDPPAQPAARERFGLDPGRPVLLVTGASQGARTINEAMVRVWPVFSRAHPEWQLFHLTGGAAVEEVRHAYAGADGVVVLGFTHEMCAALSAADVVISRAGASTLAELTALGKPSILLPYPYHRDQHQRANGQVLSESGAAILLEDALDPSVNASRILAALEELSATARREDMSAAARRIGRPEAARTIAEWMIGREA